MFVILCESTSTAGKLKMMLSHQYEVGIEPTTFGMLTYAIESVGGELG